MAYASRSKPSKRRSPPTPAYGRGAAYDHTSSTCFAFVALRPGTTVDAAAVRARVAESLGPAVVPDRVLFPDVLPRTAHDKIDRAALLAGAQRVHETPAPPVADSPAALVAAVWSELLGAPVQASSDATFFELGGNSLTVLRLARALGKVAGRPIGVKDVYRRATVAEQAELLAAP